MELARYANRRIPSEQKDVTQATLPSRHTWNKKMDTFPKFCTKMRGHYGQLGAGYLFLKDFQARYLADGNRCWIYFQDEVASESQVKKDIRSLYSALESACKVDVGQDIFLTYVDTQDGVRTWMDMINKYNNCGDRDTQIHNLEAIIETPFHSCYKEVVAVDHWL